MTTPEQRAALLAAEAGLVAVQESLRVIRASLEPVVVGPPPPVDPPAPEPPPVEPPAPAEPPVEPPAPVDPPPPPVIVPQPVGKYRNEQPHLFQGVGPIIPGPLGAPYWDGAPYCGPTPDHVDNLCGWAWRRRGGDWVDADGVLHGGKPWAWWDQPALAAAATDLLPVTMDVTALAQRPGWKAWIVRCPRAQRKVLNTDARPTLTYTYADGTTGVHPAYVMALNSSKTQPDHRTAVMPLPVFLEFDQPDPDKVLESASLALTITDAKWGSYGGPARAEVYPLTPPMNSDPVTWGLAAAYTLDEGIAAHPDVIVAHTYKLGETDEAKYVSAATLNKREVNTDDERNFDPALIDPTKPADLTKLPHRDIGKWVGQFPHGVRLAEAGDEGFVPLHPELGALRLPMRPPTIASTNGPRRLRHGDVGGYGGTLHSHAFLYLPAGRIYRQRTQFVRYYARLTYPDGAPGPADRLQLWSDTVGGQARWSELGGKFGPAAGGHHNTQGGFSGSAGGGNGTQFRLGWRECAEGVGGPMEGGWCPSFHFWDFGQRQPPGHNYAGLLTHEYCWGQRGGLGGMLYAGHWYCVEMQITLNSVDQPGVLADGTPHVVGGRPQFWTPDGEVRAWVDGRLVFEKTGMVFRTLPVHPQPFRAGYSRPIAPLGHVYAGCNVFHGGTTRDNVSRNLDLAALVVAESRIGPMAGI